MRLTYQRRTCESYCCSVRRHHINNDEVSQSVRIEVPMLPNGAIDPKEWSRLIIETLTNQMNVLNNSLTSVMAENKLLIADLQRTTTELQETKGQIAEVQAHEETR